MKKVPLRRCMACNEQREKKDLIRIVRTSENTIEIDLTNKKSGRGAYICKNEECLNKVIKSKRFERVLEVKIEPEFYDELRGVING